jgi:hypothetical protein
MMGEARVAVRLLLEHHPLCKEFAADRIRVAGVAVCSGCLGAAPAALAGLALGVVAVVRGVPIAPLLAASLTLGLPQLTTYLHRGGRGWRFAAKAVGGLGLGAAIASALALPVARGWLVAAAVALALAFAALQGVRVRSILATCDACPYRRDWDACPGFRAAGTGGPTRPGGLPALPLPPPGGHQGRPKPLKPANDTSSRNAGPAHRG